MTKTTVLGPTRPGPARPVSTKLPLDRLPTEAEVREIQRQAAIAAGFTGDPCTGCGERKVRLVRGRPKCVSCP